MHPNSRQGARRVHAAEFKAKVVARCREPGASVAAVAMANGVNANLVRKWLVGQGLKRTGLVVQEDGTPEFVVPRPSAEATSTSPALSAMKFIPVGLAAASSSGADMAPDTLGPVQTEALQIHVELRRGDAHIAVCWPTAKAQECAMWLSEVASGLLKG